MPSKKKLFHIPKIVVKPVQVEKKKPTVYGQQKERIFRNYNFDPKKLETSMNNFFKEKNNVPDNFSNITKESNIAGLTTNNLVASKNDSFSNENNNTRIKKEYFDRDNINKNNNLKEKLSSHNSSSDTLNKDNIGEDISTKHVKDLVNDSVKINRNNYLKNKSYSVTDKAIMKKKIDDMMDMFENMEKNKVANKQLNDKVTTPSQKSMDKKNLSVDSNSKKQKSAKSNNKTNNLQKKPS